jgi:ABC-2 type transport system ATP-binding protein
VEFAGVTKRFPKSFGYRDFIMPGRGKRVTALRDITLTIDEGAVVGLIGPNGAGKTTLLKILATLVVPDEGHAKVYGHDVVRQSRQARNLIGYVVTEDRSFYWRLSGRQNLRFFGVLNDVPRKALDERIASLADLLDLTPALDRHVSSYSAGMRQKLAIIRGLLAAPRLLLMDEPTRSLDATVSEKLHRFVRDDLVKQQGCTVLIATHILSEAQHMCDSLAVLNRGQVVGSGSIAELLAAREGNGLAAVAADAFAAPQRREPTMNDLLQAVLKERA